MNIQRSYPYLTTARPRNLAGVTPVTRNTSRRGPSDLPLPRDYHKPRPQLNIGTALPSRSSSMPYSSPRSYEMVHSLLLVPPSLGAQDQREFSVKSPSYMMRQQKRARRARRKKKCGKVAAVLFLVV